MFESIHIEKGIKNWEIVQQQNGSADITVSGKWKCHQNSDNGFQAIPCLRIVDEINELEIVPWQKAEINGENWSFTFNNVPCGGLYRMESRLLTNPDCPFEAGGSLIGESIHHFGVGDNYLIAGQSNASGIGRGIISDEPELGVHVLRDCKYWDIATNPLHCYKTLHSFGLPFAKLLKRKLNYPIGLIPCAVGGSHIAKWVLGDEETLYKESIAAMKDNNVKIKGVLWYQGESDAKPNLTGIYYNQFKKVVSNYRKDLNNPDLPFITAQINRCITDNEINSNTFSWDEIREIQRKASHEMKNIFIVPTIDSLKLSDAIHNSTAMNLMLGERMAMVALDEIYNKLSYKIPEIENARKTSDNTIEFHFANVQSEMINQFFGKLSYPICVEDSKGEIPIEDFAIKNNTVFIKYKRNIIGTAKAKCEYGINPSAILYDLGSQMPVLAFSNYIIK